MNKILEQRMREHEYFHDIKTPPNSWIVLRLDGRSFTTLTKDQGYDKPFSEIFSSQMEVTALTLLEELNGVYAYTESDEISILLPRENPMFSGKVEKLCSVSASLASSIFTQISDIFCSFDSRVWIGNDIDSVIDYFNWRMLDATRCGLNSACYYYLIQSGLSAEQATDKLFKTTVSDKNEILFKLGINYNNLPDKQKRGLGIAWQQETVLGYNPVKNREEEATRRTSLVLDNLPKGRAYLDMVEDIIKTGYINLK